MPTLHHIFVAVIIISAVFIAATLTFVFVLEKLPSPSGKKWGRLFASALFVTLGIRTVITARIRHWYFPEMGASGVAARVVGFLLLVIGVIYFMGWLKDRRSTSTGENPHAS